MASVTLSDNSTTDFSENIAAGYSKIANIIKRLRERLTQFGKDLRGFFDIILKDQPTANESWKTVERNRAAYLMSASRAMR